MPGKGTKDHDVSHEAWTSVNGVPCYIQRTIMFRPDSITFPKKYRQKLPCLIRIDQTFKRKPNKGKLLYPDLYILRNHMILNKPERSIQRGKCVGWVIPIQELELYDNEIRR